MLGGTEFAGSASIYIYIYICIERERERVDLEEIGINAGNWVDSAQGRNYWRALVNAACGIEPPGSISHGVG